MRHLLLALAVVPALALLKPSDAEVGDDNGFTVHLVFSTHLVGRPHCQHPTHQSSTIPVI